MFLTGLLLFFYAVLKVTSLDLEDRGSVGKPLFFFVEKPKQLSYTYEVRASEEIGAPFPVSPQTNVPLYYSDPPHACEPIQPIPSGVVLIERGECSFAAKAITASEAGAQYALITDSAAGTDDWIDMVSDETGRKSNIPVAYLPGVSGKRIRNHLMYGNEAITVTIPLNYSSLLLKDVQNKPPWELW